MKSTEIATERCLDFFFSSTRVVFRICFTPTPESLTGTLGLFIVFDFDSLNGNHVATSFKPLQDNHNFNMHKKYLTLRHHDENVMKTLVSIISV